MLVRNTENGHIYVQKELYLFDEEIYRLLKKKPIRNIPRIYEVLPDGECLIIIEEYLSGELLSEILERGPLTERKAFRIVRKLLMILEELHAQTPPIVHRDIKPSNILITPDGTVKLLDMNTAKRSLPGQKEDTALLGTAGYAAPEQYGFGASTPQTDIYAVGVLLNRMLTGEYPSRQTAGGRSGKIVERCTRMKPEERYASALDLRRVIEAEMETEGTSDEEEPDRSFGDVVRKYLPPGLRSGNLVNSLVSLFLYGFLFVACLSLNMEDSSGSPIAGIPLWIYRITCLLAVLAVILFTGNYLGIQRRIGISRIRNLVPRILCVLLVDIMILGGSLLLLILYFYFGPEGLFRGV